jgi:hypothetical protein
MRKIIPAILYLFVMPLAFSGDKSDLVTGTITVKDSFVDSRIMKFPATVETYDKKRCNTCADFKILTQHSSEGKIYRR